MILTVSALSPPPPTLTVAAFVSVTGLTVYEPGVYVEKPDTIPPAAITVPVPSVPVPPCTVTTSPVV